jgi:NitT/TauT family transport system permease protein
LRIAVNLPAKPRIKQGHQTGTWEDFAAMPTSIWRGLLSFGVGAIIWEATARYLDNKLFLVPLGAIFERFMEMARSGDLAADASVSFIEFIGGFGLAAVVGIGAGIAMSASKPIREFFEPWVSMLYATPTIALGPLFMLALGIGYGSKIALIFLTAVFPILINTVAGLTTTDRVLLEVVRSFGATRMQSYFKVRMPAALPFIIAGLRVAVARALVGVVVAELFGARAGLGFLIFRSAQVFDTAGLWVAVFILAICGVASVEFLKWLEKRMAPWRFQNIEDE